MNISDKITINTKKMPTSLRLLMRLSGIIGLLFVAGSIVSLSSITSITMAIVLILVALFLPVS